MDARTKPLAHTNTYTHMSYTYTRVCMPRMFMCAWLTNVRVSALCSKNQGAELVTEQPRGEDEPGMASKRPAINLSPHTSSVLPPDVEHLGGWFSLLR